MGKESFMECQEYLIILSLISNMEMARVKFDRFNFTSQVGLWQIISYCMSVSRMYLKL